MTRSKAKLLIMELLCRADYDLWKSYNPETAEDPEYAEEKMEELIDIVLNNIE